MIAILACRCGSSLPTARKFLQTNNVEDWMEIPVHLGKDNSLKFLARFSDDTEGYPSLTALRNLIRGSARFIVILGYNDEREEWADISHGNMKDKADAQLILERFA